MPEMTSTKRYYRKELGAMSTVWLQVGQCGNQIGLEWWQILTSESCAHQESDRYPFFTRDGKLSALAVDSELKVIRKLQKQIKRGVFRDSNIILGQRGRGNNWAYGYHGVRSDGEASLLERTMESFRKEVERRDCYSGTVLLHSLSGGTGSGLGARLCEAIRDEYPLGYILSVTVAPHQTGESPLQNYNSLLSLSWLQRYADGVLLFHNDDVLKKTSALLRNTTAAVPTGTQPQISFSSMNTYIASCLAGLMYPINMFKTGSKLSMGMEPWELLRSVCPIPAMKFLHTAQACKRGTAFWDSLASSVVHSLPRESPSGYPHYSTSVLAVARSNQDDSFVHSQNSVLLKLKQAYRCVPWNPFPLDCWIDFKNIIDPGHHSHSLTVCANHSSAVDLLKWVMEKSRIMYEARAYLHWYWKYGCEEEDFRQAFDTLHSVINNYGSVGD
ncbi:tubulin delta chain isoform X3 [Microcaecilia unicolor]|uniref:Tubulin delta chain n=1 Tax=Microcaecilia unicolor TaxID=1415580 RepID=A0A6P7XQ41_9AMPH|nr:tubulin delta chain-like isoform X3 [Microcaecilia unicolor]